jgi:hypothetical protein
MASPVDANRIATTTGSTASQNKVVNFPAGVAAGQLLLVVLRSAAADAHTTPAGYSALVLNDASDASDDVTSIFYRIAAAADTSVTVTCTTSQKYAAIAYRITGGNNAIAPQISTVVIGTTTSVDPGQITPTGGTKDYLFLWLGAWDGEQTGNPPTAPTSYVNGVISTSGTGGLPATNAQVVGYSRQATASNENPAALTLSTAPTGSSTWTVAVHPAPVVIIDLANAASTAGNITPQQVGSATAWTGVTGAIGAFAQFGGY